MAKHLTLILVTSFLYSSTITLILVAIQIENQPFNPNRCDMSAIGYVIGLAFNIFMTLCLTTIYLNLFEKIRTNYFYSLLSFLLLPQVIAIILIALIGDFSSEWLMYSIATLPYLCILTFHFLKFRKTTLPINSNEISA